jgi:hypothetical protein
MNFVHSILDFLGDREVQFEVKELDDLNTEISFGDPSEKLVLAGLKPNSVNDINRPHIDIKARIVWEDQWRRQPKAVESRILSLLKKSRRIHARETKIEAITKPQLQEFLKEHHVSQPMISKTKLGLFHKNELVAASAFGKSCPIDTESGSFLSIELIRFCNISGATVVGGMSKMMKHALKTSTAEDWSTQSTYELLGFRLSGGHPPLSYNVNLSSWERSKSADLNSETAQLINRGSLKYNTYV